MSETVLEHLSERSVLGDPSADHLKSFAVNGRRRRATCSGVAWFRGHYLAVVNLYGSSLRIYRFHDKEEPGRAPARVELLQELTEGITFPEDVAVSPDGAMVAITHSLSKDARISLHALDADSFAPQAPGECLRTGRTFHGIRFSPDGRHLALTDIGALGFVEVVSIQSRQRTCLLENEFVPLKPKCVAFSADAQYVVIVWARNVLPTDTSSRDAGLLTLHRFAESTGIITAAPAASFRGGAAFLGSPESCTFLGGRNANVYRVLITDQAADLVNAFDFDAATSAVSFTGVFAAGLSFPHGISASSDGQLVATTNYGDDTLRIHRVTSRHIAATGQSPSAAVAPASEPASGSRPRAEVSAERAHSPTILIGAEIRRVRIGLVGHWLGDVVYGAERSLLDILAALDPNEYEAVCVFPRANGDYLRTVARYTKRIHVFPYKWWHSSRRVDAATVARFEQIFRAEHVDLVHVNTITLLDPLTAARRIGVPAVVHARELIKHDAHLAEVLGEAPANVVQIMQDASDFIIANSEETRRLFTQESSGFRLYNGVDTDRFDVPVNLEPGRLRVGIISSNIPKKGIETLVRLAMAASTRRPAMEFLVVGPLNDYTEKLAAEVRQAQTPVNVRFIGYVPDPVEAMRQLDVVVSFSEVIESFGRTIVEAMAARRPVIAWDRGANPELIRHGQDGFLVPYPDITAALGHLEKLADDPELVRQMGRSARQRATELFSLDAMRPQLTSIYRAIAAKWEARGAAVKAADPVLKEFRASIAGSAAYYHSFEVSLAFRIPAGMSCSNCTDEKAGATYVRLANGKSNAASTGHTEGYCVRLPDILEAAASGHRVAVNVIARSADGGQSRFAIAYSTNEVGNSGWRWHSARAEWSVYTMEYDVPVMKQGNGDFVGILPEVEGRSGTEFFYLWINVTERNPSAAPQTADA